jgi:hypothetical protein
MKIPPTSPFVALLLTLILSPHAKSEVVVFPAKGNPLIADEIESQDDTSMIVKIYNGFKKTIPKGAVSKVEDHNKDYSEFKAPAAVRAGSSSAPAALKPERRAEIEKQIAAYFAPDADRAKILSEIKQHDEIPWSEVTTISQTIFKAARSGLKLKEGTQTFEVPEIKGIKGEVHIEVVTGPTGPAGPAGIGPKAKLPVFLILHGGGEGLGSWDIDAPHLIPLIKKKWTEGIFVCPSVMQKHYAEWGGNPDEEVYCRELLNAVKRSWNVDTDRVYLGGYSMGGYGTWHIGGHEADQFAGLVAGAGGILIGSGRGETWGWGIIANLMHLPIVFLHGTADQQAPVWSDQTARDILDVFEKENPDRYKHKYMEYANADHSAPYAHMEEAITWALAFKRDPNPKKFTWEPAREFDRSLYWLRVDKPHFFTRLEAEREGNTVKLKTKRLASGFSVMLNEQMISKDNPVTISIDGANVFKGTVYPSLSAMLESIGDRIDEEMWYSARVDF